jgi:hypothetical protein
MPGLLRLRSHAVATGKDRMPIGKPVPVTFRPGGAKGAYTADLPMTEAGYYSVTVNIRGRDSAGKEFERTAGESITIEPRRAQIIDVSESPVDEDGNGLIDRIDVTAQVKVELGGKYAMEVILTAPDKWHREVSRTRIYRPARGPSPHPLCGAPW